MIHNSKSWLTFVNTLKIISPKDTGQIREESSHCHSLNPPKFSVQQKKEMKIYTMKCVFYRKSTFIYFKCYICFWPINMIHNFKVQILSLSLTILNFETKNWIISHYFLNQRALSSPIPSVRPNIPCLIAGIPQSHQ